MAKKAGTVRTTISVPRDLKRRMDKVASENWSALACAAFEKRINEISANERIKGMKDVIARLKATKANDVQDMIDQGREAATLWVKEHAEFAELKRLERGFNSVSQVDQWSLYDTGDGDAYGAGQRFVFMVQPENDGDREAADGFWETLLGDDASATDSAEFMEAFFGTALELWSQLQSEI